MHHSPKIRGRGPATLVLGAVLATLTATAVAPMAALAQGGWHQVTGIEGIAAKNTDEIGLERTADGVLHVAWTREQGSADALLHTPIAADGGSVGPPSPIFATSGGGGINNRVDLAAGPDGLRVFFSALVEGQPFNGVMATATAPLPGQPWSGPAAASANAPGANSPVYAASGIGAAVAGGVPISIWGDSSPSGGGLHLRIDLAVPDAPLPADCCQVDPNIAVDSATGATVAAWSQIGPANGLQVLPLTPAGPLQTAPGSAAVGAGQRVSVSGRIGAPGIFAAYGSGENQFDATPALWALGAPAAKLVKGERDGEHTVLAPAPGGRLWMAWDRENRVGALRTNAAASKLGAVVTVKPPPGTTSIHRLGAEGSQGAQLDLLALVETAQGLGYWHRRVLPGLALKLKPKKAKAGQKVTLKVTDAGDPVAGAKVKLKLPGKDPKATTKSSGKVKLKVPAETRPGRYKAKATKAGYAPTKKRLRVKGN